MRDRLLERATSEGYRGYSGKDIEELLKETPMYRHLALLGVSDWRGQLLTAIR